MARLLVIDDEPLVGMVIRRALEDAHHVTVEESARAALRLIEGGAKFDAILTDLHMPDGDGLWLREEIGRLDPVLQRRMLFLTGGATQAEEDELRNTPGIRWLAKPFRSAELLAQVEQLLSS